MRNWWKAVLNMRNNLQIIIIQGPDKDLNRAADLTNLITTASAKGAPLCEKELLQMFKKIITAVLVIMQKKQRCQILINTKISSSLQTAKREKRLIKSIILVWTFLWGEVLSKKSTAKELWITRWCQISFLTALYQKI